MVDADQLGANMADAKTDIALAEQQFQVFCSVTFYFCNSVFLKGTRKETKDICTLNVLLMSYCCWQSLQHTCKSSIGPIQRLLPGKKDRLK